MDTILYILLAIWALSTVGMWFAWAVFYPDSSMPDPYDDYDSDYPFPADDGDHTEPDQEV